MLALRNFGTRTYVVILDFEWKIPQDFGCRNRIMDSAEPMNAFVFAGHSMDVVLIVHIA